MVLGSDDPDDDKTVDSPDEPDDDEPTSTPNNLSPTSGPNSSPNSAPTGGPSSVGNSPTSGPAGNSPTIGPASVGNSPTSGPAGNSPSLPTSGPNSNPTNFKSCADSPLRMKIVIKGKTRGKSCIWASRKNTESRCSFATVASHCPITCAKYGGDCNVDSQARIRVEKIDGKKMMRS